MERESQPPHTRLTQRLSRDIGHINFYRFCQLLERYVPESPALGSTSDPADDPIRFRPHPGMGFPVSELKAIEHDPLQPSARPTVRTTFMGLYGVDSPLPTGYLDDITLQREGHESLEAFLDIFNHRILTQFYRIWRKYSYPATFEPGGQDKTSQCLLGLIGLGIPGTANHVATPVSRFLALLGIMRQPARTAEGVQAVVKLLAPFTQAQVVPHCLRPVPIASPAGFYDDKPLWLDGRTVLGDEALDANSQLLITLSTENQSEAQGWLPEGQCYRDFMVLLRVYLGWRYKARAELMLPTRLLPALLLGDDMLLLGLNTVLGLTGHDVPPSMPSHYIVELGHYCGLLPAKPTQGNRRVNYYLNPSL